MDFFEWLVAEMGEPGADVSLAPGKIKTVTLEDSAGDSIVLHVGEHQLRFRNVVHALEMTFVHPPGQTTHFNAVDGTAS
jgi:hypothetical protein